MAVHYETLNNKYQRYINTWDEIYRINSDQKSLTNGLFNDIKVNLIDTGYFTAQEIIGKIKVVSETRLCYRHAYIEIMKKLSEEYHCENSLNISFLSEYDNVIKNTYKEAILNDDEEALRQFLKSEKIDLSELLESCCLNGARFCFELLRTGYNVRITKKCLDEAIKGQSKYIIEKCLNEQTPDTSPIEAAIASHNSGIIMRLITDYKIQISGFHMPILPLCHKYLNLEVFLIYLLEYHDINGCLVFSPVYHIRDLCKYLYANGGNIRASDPDGGTALHLAITENQTDIAKDFISFGSDIEALEKILGRPLNVAVSVNNSVLVELLVSHGADINIHDPKSNFSLLHTATIFRNKKVIEFLIKHGTEINENSNRYGLTPLMLASLLNYKEIVQFLISDGARISVTDKFGNNAIAYALLYNNKEFMEITLRRFNQVFEYLDYITFDLKSSNNDLIALLLSKGVNIIGQNIHGNTPLHIAALMSNKENAELIISHGADINSLNENEQTPLDIAIMRGRKEYSREVSDIDNEDNQALLDFLEKKSEMVALFTMRDASSYSNKEFKNNDILEIMFDYFWGRYQIGNPCVKTVLVFLGVAFTMWKIAGTFSNRLLRLIFKTIGLVFIGQVLIHIFSISADIILHYFDKSIFWY
ncbi:hypothetical protein TVAG_222770 [Trichomonas vaginalis G3]|uniref:DUF3447 domain-containing protein n=1 Tax=Trichomonas vaginalis (strain ATCC PRA-98 / G3) TaxID=412133 RepID=A2FHX2_TRIV3|nr:spectrin binding [Trichomonas vaginalis G3]EAX95481.1 hypothetical protein TVAG_222770 [Trichomonas vaginalis G3]KAI5531086.1 spectrin binding [Trichomonas vaginalis G3]|eukprot:XP_001308411.1 hypothetical protein [Trichomonas vaginalis G3]